ncbi:hypothetical protein HBI38_070850 [Parastagonospora nodorum]|nr:hypothetical protein HBI79_056640 [Parastagonospora nodorum]KAH6095846.1 hypothetical protein HBI65_103670 [Parastagonospora nodorum]KAH6324927.1 hypothetical protein HBI38_070850 [Parastagonospora nodorum]
MSETALVTTTAALGLVRVYDDGDAKLIVTLSSERLATCNGYRRLPLDHLSCLQRSAFFPVSMEIQVVRVQ